jgi:hypothetical protein
MVDVKLVRDLDYPVATVWGLLGDYGNMSWMDGPPKHEIVGEGVGMIRRVLMEGMDPIDEVLESYDDATMSYSYSIPRGMPLPVTDYLSSCRVEERESGHARVHWSCRCTPVNGSMSEADTQALLEDTYNMMLNWLEDYLKSH